MSQWGHPTRPDDMTLRRTLTPDRHMARHCADRLMDYQCLPPPTGAWTQGPEQSRSISCGFMLQVSLYNPVVITCAVLKQVQRYYQYQSDVTELNKTKKKDDSNVTSYMQMVCSCDLGGTT